MSARTIAEIWVGAKHASGDRVLTWSIGCHAAAGKIRTRGVYVARLVYWTIRHRSIETARWVVEYEGHTW